MWIWIIGIIALFSCWLFYAYFLVLPKGVNTPMLTSSKFKNVLYMLNIMPTFWDESHLNYAERFHQFIIGCMHMFRKEGIVYFPYVLGNGAFAFKAEHLEKLYKSNTHGKEQKFVGDVLKTGLIPNNPPLWNHRRKINTPAYNVSVIDHMIDVMNVQARKFVKAVGNQKDIDPEHAITEMCFFIITECFTGIKINLDDLYKNHDVTVDFIKEMEIIFSRRMVRPYEWFTPIFNLLKSGKELKRQDNAINRAVDELISDRIKQLKKKGDISKVLSEGHEKKNQPLLDALLYHLYITKGIDYDGMRDEVKTAVAAATDAPIFGLLYILFLIALHPDVHRKVQAEMDSIFSDDPDRDVTVEDLKKMKYTDMAIKEALRIFPPINTTIRENLEELDLDGGIKLPKNTSCIIFFYGLHRDERFFPNPEVYDPERFNPEKCQSRHPYAYLPFSGGQRNCIGQRFAMNEMKVALAHLIRRYNLKSLQPRDKVMFEARLSMRPAQPGIHFSILERDERREAIHG